MIAGIIVGLVIGTPAGMMLLAMLISGARADAERQAFDAGVAHERERRSRAIARLRPRLRGDDATELGIVS